jgi:hypothetical protein
MKVASIPAVIADVVNEVRHRYDNDGVRPFFDHGHMLQMVNKMIEKGASKTWKKNVFPAILLVEDIKERINPDQHLADLRIFIITSSEQKYDSDDRYLHSFDPTLTPLFELFMEELANSRQINGNVFTLEKTNRISWGDQWVIGNDFIDAIELNIQNVQFLKSC